MQLINTDGMAFIGPGSEWFWTALTGLVLAITFIAIYRQLRVQAHASAVEQVETLEREFRSEGMNRHVLEVLIALREGTDLPRPAAIHVADFWETFASLARTGHRDPKLLWQMRPGAAQHVWATLKPWVQRERAEWNDPGILRDLEWLAGVMAEMDRRAGRPPITSARIARVIENEIAKCQEEIRIAQAMRTVTLVQPDALTDQHPAAAAAPAE